MSRVLIALGVFLTSLLMSSIAGAQSPLGTFRWQLQPYCNIVTLTVTQNGPVYEMEGTDDQCGAGQAASAVGTAFLNPDGSIGFGLNIVTAPGGAPVHVEASIELSTLGGTWRDSLGGTGPFVFTPGQGIGGNPRPAPSSAIPTGSVGGAQINPAQVQLRVGGTCSSGSFMQGVAENGTVSCASGGGDITGVNAGPGLVGGGSSGSVTLALPTTTVGGIFFGSVYGLVAGGTPGQGSIPISGPGARMMWYPRKAAFRAGNVDTAVDAWDDANIGSESVAFNKNTRATGVFSVALGDSTLASGTASTAMGRFTTASADRSTAMGSGATASAVQSIAIGSSTTASGVQSIAMGSATTASGVESTAMGSNTIASGPHATATGLYTVASGVASFTAGDNNLASGLTAFAAGYELTASGNRTVVLGSFARSLVDGAFVFGDSSTGTPVFAVAPNSFTVRAAGGYTLFSNSAKTTGVTLAPGGGAWANLSDVNMKENFRDLDSHDVLARIARMPIKEWNYKTQHASIRHVGPTAQDFHSAFGLGEDPLRISTIDADGIALAGLKALEARAREQHDAVVRQNEALLAEMASLRARLERIEAKEP